MCICKWFKHFLLQLSYDPLLFQGVPFVWRLRQDTTRMGNKSEQCTEEVRKRENLYSKDFHFRATDRSEYTTVQNKVDGTDNKIVAYPEIKYLLISHCKGYRWKYVPNPKTSSAMYVEYPELRDYFQIGDQFYGVFSSALSNEQGHASSSMPNSNFQHHQGSAICTFNMDEIISAFDGPFKKKDKISGNYRPFGTTDTNDINPSPYSPETDSSAQQRARNIKNMTIDFLDPSQPYAKELRHIDLREHSPRLKFFEEDVYGSRTMWNDVKTDPLFSQNDVVFEQIVGETVSQVSLLYVSTSEGLIYKIASTQNEDAKCRMTNATNYLKWLNTTASMSSIWDNEFYAYYNRTVDSTTFAASFTSDLSREKGVKFPDDTLLKSDWDCSASAETSVLSVFKPYSSPTKIWDMKLATTNGKSYLVVASDAIVKRIPTVQCDMYAHCKSCSADPHCKWTIRQETENNTRSICIPSEGAVTTANTCDCKPKVINHDLNENLILPGIDQTFNLDLFQWYHNYTAVKYQAHALMYSYDTSLIIFNALSSHNGLFELKNIKTQECLVSYRVKLSTCEDESCRYETTYREWCNQYNNFLEEYIAWENDYVKADYCKNLL